MLKTRVKSFADLCRVSRVSHVGHLRFFCLHRITCLRIPTVTQA